MPSLPIRDDIDGRVIEELFTKEFREHNPVPERVPAEAVTGENFAEVYSEDDEEAIKKRLTDLGYM